MSARNVVDETAAWSWKARGILVEPKPAVLCEVHGGDGPMLGSFSLRILQCFIRYEPQRRTVLSADGNSEIGFGLWRTSDAEPAFDDQISVDDSGVRTI